VPRLTRRGRSGRPKAVCKQLPLAARRFGDVRLIIAEKPSLARAIAAALPGQQRRSKHSIQCGEGDVVAWCAGHVLEMAPPEDYSPTFASWTLETLPIVPERWLHRVSSRELVDNLARLLAK